MSSTLTAYGIAGQHAVNLNINNITVPIFPKDNEIHLMVAQNVNQILPTLKIHLLDFYGLYNTPNGASAINDGTPINLSFNDGNSGLPPVVNYQAFGTPKRMRHSSGYNELIVYGILNNTSYIRETVNRGMTGAASQVMNNIASLLNMSYVKNDTTNDTMTWLPGRGTWAKFAANITKHAYTDNQSSFSHAVDESNTLYFINLQKLFAGKTYKALFYFGCLPQNTSEPTYEIYQHSGENHSGFLNHLYGYGMRQGQTSTTGAANIYTNVNATYVAGSNLDINRDNTHNLSNRTRIQIAPMDSGGSHANWAVAKHQNARLKATFSQELSIIHLFYSGLKLYDVVRAKIYKQGVIDSVNSGTYCVIGIVRGIRGAQFFERLLLASNGPNNVNASIF